MAGILDGVMQQMNGESLQKMSNALGTDPATTNNAVNAALPVLVAALANNSASLDGANALAGALDRDHDGSALNNVSALLDGAQGGMGAKILGHILGARQPGITQSLGKATGLDSGKTGLLLAMLAPMVLSYLGKAKRERGLDAGGLGAVLGSERDGLASRGGALGGLLSMLDRDKDGSVVDDMSGMLGGMFKR